MKRDYWCIVFLDDIDHDKNRQYYIVKQSEDCITDELFIDGAYDDSLHNFWKNIFGEVIYPLSGLYHLTLAPWAYGPDISGEYDCGIDVVKAELLYELKQQKKTCVFLEKPNDV